MAESITEGATTMQTTTTYCAHEYIEYDETQVADDDFRIEPTGTCENCGVRVEWVEDWDDEGSTYHLTEIEGGV